MQIEIRRADITTLDVDAIVNAANEQLRAGSGVCGAIFAAAGTGLSEACESIGRCPTGDAVLTPGFDLAARWIVHTVGPVWHGGGAGEPRALASCYRRSIQVAASAGARSVAFPAISTGVYGYPPEGAAEVAVEAVTSAARDPRLARRMDLVVLCAFDDATARRYRELTAR